jgi:hypothetical protein
MAAPEEVVVAESGGPETSMALAAMALALAVTAYLAYVAFVA